MEVVVTTGAINRAKLQSNHHHQQTNIHFFTGQMSFLSPNQQCQSSEGKATNQSIKNRQHTESKLVLVINMQNALKNKSYTK